MSQTEMLQDLRKSHQQSSPQMAMLKEMDQLEDKLSQLPETISRELTNTLKTAIAESIRTAQSQATAEFNQVMKKAAAEVTMASLSAREKLIATGEAVTSEAQLTLLKSLETAKAQLEATTATVTKGSKDVIVGAQKVALNEFREAIRTEIQSLMDARQVLEQAHKKLVKTALISVILSAVVSLSLVAGSVWLTKPSPQAPQVSLKQPKKLS